MPYDIEFDARELIPDTLRPPGGLVALAERLLSDEGVEEGAGLTLLLADDGLLRALNESYRGVDAPTDVLSFAAQEIEEDGESDPFFALEDAAAGSGEWPPSEVARYLGDIAISVETARRQATEAGLSVEDELSHLVLHGVLHLLGWDHETDADDAAMRAKEESYLGAHIHASGAHAHE